MHGLADMLVFLVSLAAAVATASNLTSSPSPVITSETKHYETEHILNQQLFLNYYENVIPKLSNEEPLIIDFQVLVVEQPSF